MNQYISCFKITNFKVSFSGESYKYPAISYSGKAGQSRNGIAEIYLCYYCS